MIAAGCRFFAGYPMTPFTEVLEHMARRLPEVGGVCMNAESELEAVGMAWGVAATGTPAATGSTGQGLSLIAGVAGRDHPCPAAAGGAEHGPGPGRLLAGHARRRARRLPPHRAGAGRRGRGGGARPVGISPDGYVAEPGARVRRLLPGAHGAFGRHQEHALRPCASHRLGPDRGDRRDGPGQVGVVPRLGQTAR